jgi:serine/threonine-protein kinase HipA
MSALTVYRSGERVGRLVQDDSGSLNFSYDQTWLAKPDAIPLSRSLPLQKEPFSGKKARPFFAGILPEEGPRKIIAKILGISDANDFAMLERIGGECAGAVALFPEGSEPTARKGSEYRSLNDQELQQIVAELPRRPLMAGTEGVRLSLAGAQNKLPVVVRGREIGLPLGDTPSTHILKPEPDDYPGLALNEWFCMCLGRAMGLNVAQVEYRVIGDRACLLVQRYDRKTDGRGATTRIHQEDFCQALGFPPERKYQAEGGPTLRDCIYLLREWSTAPALDIPAFVNGLIFTVLIGNADAHGKNYAMLYIGGERRLAPFYDLVSTVAWPELSKHAAMKVGGCDSINAFSAGDWKKMATASGLGWPLVRERISDICRELPGKLDVIRNQAREHNGELAERVHDLIRDRSTRMLESVVNRD